MEKLLVTGACGLLGRKVIKGATAYECHATDSGNNIDLDCNYSKLDITDKQKIISLIERINPDLIIHTAALTDVDFCQTDKDMARKVNIEGTKNVAEGCERTGAKMVYVSTDFVFDGKKGNYSEDDMTNPISYYGTTKLEGERAIEEFDIEYSIGRTSVLYGEHPKNFNFVMWVIEKLTNRERINIVTDQFSSPTLADNLADMLFAIGNRTGIYHTAGRQRISRYGFALKIAEIFQLDRELIRPIKTKDLGQTAGRPMDSSLDTTKAESELGVKILDIEEGLSRMKQNMQLPVP